MAPRSFFLVLEGLDGSGKDAVLARLLTRFCDEAPGNPLSLGKHQKVARTREPTAHSDSGRWISEKLRDGSLGKEDPAVVAGHYVTDRKAHGAELRWLLAHGYVILSSRYDLSTYAYQGAQGVPLSDLYGIHGYARGACLVPDLTLFIDVPAETAVERIAARGGDREYFERKEMLEQVRRGYLAAVAFLRERDGRALNTLDGTRPLEAVVSDATTALAAALLGPAR